MSILVRDLTVRYGAQAAVDGLSLEVPEGALFGLLGPNGAGKSSTIRCIATTQLPTSGSISVGGIDALANPAGARALLGVVPQGIALYDALDVVQNLQLFGGLYGLGGAELSGRVEWGLELAQLGAHRRKVVASLSGGMKRRLNIACSLLHHPSILVFDEPTAGVDPQSRNHIFETVRRLHAEGRTVVYTTHYMEEVEALCSLVAIVDRGRLVSSGTLAELTAAAQARRFRVELAEGADAAALRAALDAAGVATTSVEAERLGLEDVFLAITGRDLRDGT